MPKAGKASTSFAAFLHPMQMPNPTTEMPVRGKVLIPVSFFPDGPDPDAYALVLNGNCLKPQVCHEDMVIISPAAPLRAGELVVLHLQTGRPQVKRLVVLPPPFDIAPGSDVAGVVIVEMLNPLRPFAIPVSKLVAIHAVVGVLRPDQYREARAAAEQAA